MHPNCRSTTIAAFDDDNIADLTRRARDPETGKYVEVPADLSYNEWVKRYIPEKALRPQDDKRIIIDSGAIKRADFTRMETHAKMFYEEIRKRKTDINTIAENTDFSVEDVEKIKNHIFFNKYDLSDGYGRFYESYDQAVSWQNLILGGKRIREMDIILLRHELMEYNLMNHEGLSYNEAHKIAEEKYNYSKYVKELNLREGIK
jgi:hypothetical protein